MCPSESVVKMWVAYHQSIGLVAPKEPVADSFGDNEKGVDELSILVNQGIKRATASALWTLEKTGSKIPAPGEVFVVTNWAGDAVCIVRTNKVTVVPFNKISEDQACIEGEGDRSLAHWRRVHIQFYQNEFKKLNLTFDESMPIVFEEFERVFP